MTIKVKIMKPQNFIRNKTMLHCKGQKCSFNWYGTTGKARSIVSINIPPPPPILLSAITLVQVFFKQVTCLGLLYIVYSTWQKKHRVICISNGPHLPFYNMKVNTLRKKTTQKVSFFLYKILCFCSIFLTMRYFYR